MLSDYNYKIPLRCTEQSLDGLLHRSRMITVYYNDKDDDNDSRVNASNDRLQRNIGFILRRVLAVFMGSAVTPPKVNVRPSVRPQNFEFW